MKLDVVAQLTEDAYYKEFAKDSDFFKIEDFIGYCAVSYSIAMQEAFDLSIKKNASLNGVAEPQLSEEWFTVKPFHVEHSKGKYSVKIGNVFSFQNDSFISGIKSVTNVDQKCTCNTFAKISIENCSTLKFLPQSDKTVYYYSSAGMLYFERVKCQLGDVNIVYIPAYESPDDAESINVPDTLVENIIMRTLNVLREKGTFVIDKTNNQNPNKSPQTEAA